MGTQVPGTAVNTARAIDGEVPPKRQQQQQHKLQRVMKCNKGNQTMSRAKPRLFNKSLIVYLVTLLLCSFTTNADYIDSFGLMRATAVESQEMIQFG